MDQQIEMPLMMQARSIVGQGVQQKPGQIWERLTREQKQAVMQQIQVACRVLTRRQKPRGESSDDHS